MLAKVGFLSCGEFRCVDIRTSFTWQSEELEAVPGELGGNKIQTKCFENYQKKYILVTCVEKDFARALLCCAYRRLPWATDVQVFENSEVASVPVVMLLLLLLWSCGLACSPGRLKCRPSLTQHIVLLYSYLRLPPKQDMWSANLPRVRKYVQQRRGGRSGVPSKVAVFVLYTKSNRQVKKINKEEVCFSFNAHVSIHLVLQRRTGGRHTCTCLQIKARHSTG